MRTVLLLVLALTAAAAIAAEVAGVQIPDRAQVEGRPLVLNGAGLRRRIVFKVYIGALYLAEKTSSASEALASKGAKRISMTLLRDLTAQQLIDALEDGVRANNDGDAVAAVQSRLDTAIATMRDIGAAKQGSVIALDYLPGTGTRISVDGVEKGPRIPGEDFYAALLRIWLGDKPVEGSLKKAMLGQAG
jgi:hypothetical protein